MRAATASLRAEPRATVPADPPNTLPLPDEAAAAAPRLATSHPGRYLISAAHLPPPLLERLENPPHSAVSPRPAATVVLLREHDAPPRVEALLLRRPGRSRFAAGAWVFPGGVVDAADAAAALAVAAAGPPPEAWAARLDLAEPGAAFAFVVAAIREVWEETGILLAEGGTAATCDAARAALLAGERSFAQVLGELGLPLATGALLYAAHWITPEPEPRRYDTRFFLARVPPDAVCRLHGDELAEARWLAPADALAAYHAGRLPLLPPTADTLRRIAGFASLDALWHALRDQPVPTILPRMRRTPEGVVVEYG